MGTTAKKDSKKTAAKSNFVKPVLAWTILALELFAVILIGCLVCR